MNHRAPSRGAMTATAKTPDRGLLQAFLRDHDGQAFAGLVDRHGPVVMGVCRRILGHSPDADDAFQATFLTLTRNAKSIRNPEKLASWLYGVAYRTAVRAKQQNHHRKTRERESSLRRQSPTDPLEAITGRELLRRLDQEIASLPEQPRAVLVLCYLQGQTHGDAARTLGLSKSTLRRRLDAAVSLLRTRLSRSGLALSSALVLLALTQPSWAARIPGALASSTLKSALALAAGRTKSIAAPILNLVEGGLWTMAVSKPVQLTALVVTCLLLVTAVWGGGNYTSPEAPPANTIGLPAVPAEGHPSGNRVELASADLPGKKEEPLPRGPLVQFGALAFRHRAGVAVHYAPDGKRLLVYEPDHTVRVLDAVSGKLLERVLAPSVDPKRLPAHRRDVRSARFTADGDRVFTLTHTREPGANRGLAVTLWNIKDCKERQLDIPEGVRNTFQATAPQVWDVLPDGRQLALIVASEDAGGGDHVLIWDVEKNKAIKRLKPDSVRLVAIQFSADGKRLVAGDDSLGVWIWETESGKLIQHILAQRHTISAVSLSPDGRLLATTGHDRRVRFWDTNTGEEKASFAVLAQATAFAAPDRIQFSPRGNRLLVIGVNVTSALWEVDRKPTGDGNYDLTVRQQIQLSSVGGASPAAFSSEGQTVALACNDGTVRQLDTIKATFMKIPDADGHSGPINCLAISPDGKVIATGGDDATIRLWELTTGKPLQLLRGKTGSIAALAFSPDSKLLASADNTTAVVWDVVTGKERIRVSGQSWVAFADEGKMLVARVESKDGKTELVRYDVARGTQAEANAVAKGWVAHADNGRKAALHLTDRTEGRLVTWDVKKDKEGKELWRGPLRESGPEQLFPRRFAPVFSSDGTRLAVRIPGGIVRVWDVESGKELCSLADGNRGAVRQLPIAFSPSKKHLAVAQHHDQSVAIYDLVRNSRSLTIAGHLGAAVKDMRFTADEKYLVTLGADRTIAVWEVPRPRK